METDLALLEQKVALLIAHAEALRVANETLRRELAAAQAANGVLSQRMQQASVRVDALLDRLPER